VDIIKSQRASTWVSHGLETLVDEHRWMGDPQLKADGDYDFDVVIIGSGYGGSIAAAELSACREDGAFLKICVLERGKEYLSGMFPSRLADLPGHVRFVTPFAQRQTGAYDGLFDIRWGNDVVAVLASGVGGGSLINAGVMEMPHPDVFKESRWPKALRDDGSIAELAKNLQLWLGANALNPFDFSKYSVLNRLSGKEHVRPVQVSVAPPQGPDRPKGIDNAAGVFTTACNLCGDCATGCNHNAKDSLDRNLLRLAWRDGARIVTGATVISVDPAENGKGWRVNVNHTDAHLRDRQITPFVVRARRVILAAGTFGSTEILMRSEKLELSSHLGRNFSANGDMIAAVHDLRAAHTKGVADETVDPAEGVRAIGPTITGMIDLRTGDPESDLVIQDLAVPGPLRRLFEESFTTTDVLNRLVANTSTDQPNSSLDDAAVDSAAFSRSLLLAMIGRDTASGTLTAGNPSMALNADGLLTVRWPDLRRDTRFSKHHERLDELLKYSGLDGRVVKNPMWSPLSDRLERVFGAQRGPLVTVHPLGGCIMADDVRKGVTDHCGRVFNNSRSSPTSTYDGLVVLDGSIVPTSLGINPALTIGALSLRAIVELKRKWSLTGGRLDRPPPDEQPDQRPIFSVPRYLANPIPTKIELTEQMRGDIEMRGADGKIRTHKVELTLNTEPVAIADLIDFNASNGRLFKIPPASGGKPAGGHLRILLPDKTFDPISHDADPQDVALIADIDGYIRLFAISRPTFRVLTAFWAWLRNRGLRDITQTLVQVLRQKLTMVEKADLPRRPFSDKIRDFVRLFSRAGSIRSIEYEFTIHDVQVPNACSVIDPTSFDKQPISGRKRLTYARCSSPWAQLMEMRLERFPGLVSSSFLGRGKAPTMTFNPRYIARKGVPLFRIVGQQDRMAALVDLASLGLYIIRVLLQVHALSFRMPDAPAEREPRRLPGILAGIAPPQIDHIVVDRAQDRPVYIRVARYDGRRRPGSPSIVDRPVLLIHGYSASGTTFVHHSVKGNLVQKLVEAGRDVWVLDMRSSTGLETATADWAFEQMAQNDIPLAIKHVRAAYSDAVKVDVVTHCMGGAMFSMAILSERDRNGHPNTLHEKIGRVVFSQVGPVMMLSSANVLAAYIMRYTRQFLPLERYEFSPRGEKTLVGQLLDRALSAIPVPQAEFLRENPLWPPGKATPWVVTRHRMDALYSRTFSLENLPKSVLAHIDDFFGPLSVETVSQVIHFSGFSTVTDRFGVNQYVSPKRVRERMKFPIMSIHGEDNGLVDVATLALMRNIVVVYDGNPKAEYLNGHWNAVETHQKRDEIEKIIDEACLAPDRASLLTWRIKAHGHQDCLIGKDADQICGVIARYLCRADPQVNNIPQKPITKSQQVEPVGAGHGTDSV
jgi:cholesterol oxidase